MQKKKDGWSNNPKSGNLEKQEVVNSDAFGTEYSQRVTSTRIILSSGRYSDSTELSQDIHVPSRDNHHEVKFCCFKSDQYTRS